MECGHCGDVAVTPLKGGFYQEGMADRCESCGYPGQVIVDDVEWDEEGNGVRIAHWATTDEPGARCRHPYCAGCEDDA